MQIAAGCGAHAGKQAAVIAKRYDGDLEREYRRSPAGGYWVYYTFDDEALTIWRVFHTRQDVGNYTVIDVEVAVSFAQLFLAGPQLAAKSL